MNNGASAYTVDDVPRLSLGTGDRTTNNGEEETASPTGNSPHTSPNVWVKKRKECLKQLITALDLLIYIQLATTHYMDCSILLFFARAAVQFSYLTPKALATPFPKLTLPAVLASNLLCILLHIFTRAPSAGEATRGYMHGSLLLDFVGQKGPTSKIRLLGLDILVLGLQMLMLAVKEEMKKGNHSYRAGRRPGHVSEEVGIELQSLVPRSRRNTGSSVEEGSNAVSMEMYNMVEFQESEATTTNPLDEMHAGQVILAYFDILDMLRNQFWDYRNGPRGEV